MIAVDTNLLVYAHRGDADWYDAAAASLRKLAEERAPWAIPWPCIYEFYSGTTHPRIWDPPTSVAGALAWLDAWMESPSLVLLAEGAQHWDQLRPLLTASRISGPRVHDARIASLCLAHGVRKLWTADRGFSRFPSLVTTNPLTFIP